MKVKIPGYSPFLTLSSRENIFFQYVVGFVVNLGGYWRHFSVVDINKCTSLEVPFSIWSCEAGRRLKHWILSLMKSLKRQLSLCNCLGCPKSWTYLNLKGNNSPWRAVEYQKRQDLMFSSQLFHPGCGPVTEHRSVHWLGIWYSKG